MAYEDDKRRTVRGHEVSMIAREKLDVSGVEDVTGFDESTVILKTALGVLTVHGDSLHVDKIDLDTGDIELRGKIKDLGYDDAHDGSTFWARLFG